MDLRMIFAGACEKVRNGFGGLVRWVEDTPQRAAILIIVSVLLNVANVFR